MKYTALGGQSIYDVCLQTYGDLSFVRKLITENNIGDINAHSLAGTVFTFDQSQIVDNSIFLRNKNENIFYITGDDHHRYIATEARIIITTESGLRLVP